MNTIWGYLFGCRHAHTSRAFTIRQKGIRHTYVVCLSCGRKFPYDWERMEIAKVGGGSKIQGVRELQQKSL